uniref:Uncharacterized protein n=1 Tax=Globisporangium ultimum (strain ATCC 200006 / CBS 805.95 / DAOM BR144) TaxID=431595 RepID=K3X2G6_GLOUD
MSLSYSVSSSQDDTMKLLIDCNADVAQNDKYERSLPSSAQEGSADTIQLLVDFGFNIAESDIHERKAKEMLCNFWLISEPTSLRMISMEELLCRTLLKEAKQKLFNCWSISDVVHCSIDYKYSVAF